jgi:hypothetical protein
MIKKRGLASFILLSIITLGIYCLYRYYVLARDVNIMCKGDGKKTGGLAAQIFFGIITFGIYDLVWLYMLGDRLQDNAPRYNLTFKESGGTVLLWYLLGSFFIIGPFIALYIIFKNVNALADQFNYQNNVRITQSNGSDNVFCIKCGHRLQENTRFCTNCGAKIPE